MSELKALLRKRTPLYAQATHTIDTSNVALDETVERVLKAVNAEKTAKAAHEAGVVDAQSVAPRPRGASGARTAPRRAVQKEVRA